MQKITLKCINCGIETKGRGLKCISCSKKGNDFGKFNKGKIRLDFRGDGNPRWNGGRGITGNGYIEVIADKNNSINARGRILEHRKVMEDALGRRLLKREVVHHINGNRQDNRLDNLELLSSQREHKKRHPETEDKRKKISISAKKVTHTKEWNLNVGKAQIGNRNGLIYCPENITYLNKNEILIFGSNLNGKHLGGCAKLAKEKFGAVDGIAVGLSGQSYAFPTLDKEMNRCSIEFMTDQVKELKRVCLDNSDKIFLLTKVGCGIAGFKEEEISPLFKNMPINVKLPKGWIKR